MFQIVKLLSYLKISSRTLHIPWDAAGCLCPVGDLFNYSAPGEEPTGCESMEHATHDLVNGDSSGTLDVDVSDSRRLTDGGFEKDIDSYCFYAKKSYKKGEQVICSFCLLLKISFIAAL